MNYLSNLMLENEIDIFGEKLDIIGQELLQLNEGVTDLSVTNLPDMFDEAIKRLAAAKQGLGLANRLKDPNEKKEHASRILGNLNRLRALVDRLAKATAEQVSSSVSNNFQQTQMTNRNNAI